MTDKKFELTNITIEHEGRTLYRITALRDFADVKAGDLGGYLETESNLSHEGNAWVSDNAKVFGNAWVYDNAQVYDNAWVSDDAQVYGNAWVYGDAWVSDNAWVCDDLTR